MQMNEPQTSTTQVKGMNGTNGVHHAMPWEKLEQPQVLADSVKKHLLVPIRLQADDRATVMLALEMAALYRGHAAVTLLHVLSPEPEADGGSLHWLNAIDNLHRALSRSRGPSLAAVEKVRKQIGSWLETTVPEKLRGAVTLQSECRVGEPATEIARYAKEQRVDLVILCNQNSRWRRWSLWPRLTDRIVALTETPVMLVRARPDTLTNLSQDSEGRRQ